MSHVRLALLAVLLASTQAYGLLTLEGGKAQVGVIGRASFNWDSNLFNNANSEDDSYELLVAGITYDRNAGIIGVKGSAIWSFDFFNKFSSENSADPELKLGFSKARGKTTGALEFTYHLSSQADDAANQRTRLAEFGTNLTVQYPLNQRFSLTSTTEVQKHGYKDIAFYDNDTFSESLDAFMAYTSKLDIFAGYRYRFTNAQGQPDTVDHAFTVGVRGKILPKLDGTFRIGYQVRDIRQIDTGSLDGVTASASFLWAPRSRILVSSQISKDFSTTSTALSSDGLAWFNQVQVTTSWRIAMTAGAGYSQSKYYSLSEHVRTDDRFYWQLGASYPITTNINAEATFIHSENWSTESFADYTKEFVSLGIAAKF